MWSSQNRTSQTGSYAYAKEDDKVALVEKPCHLPQKR